VGVQQVCSLSPSEGGQFANARQIDAAPAAKHFNQEALVPQLATERAQVVETGKHEAISVAKPARQPSGQHLGSTDVEAVQNLANRRSVAT
jgi:hypothetical protein